LVLVAKIFEIRGDIEAQTVVERLTDFRREESYQTGQGDAGTLVTEVLDIEEEGGLVSGIFSKDILREYFYRREPIETPTTEEAPFWITSLEERGFLIVLAPSVARGVKKLLTSHVANSLSEELFGNTGEIVEVRISHETLMRLHESNPQATNLIWFDDVDIPGVEKLCLSGSGLADTELYHDYLEHGKIWYVVFEAQNRGVVVGITRNGVVTLFSKSTIGDFMNYILEGPLTLIE
jgi:hypothetical protein